MKTRLDLRNAVARHLGLVQSGSEPEGYDAARIDEVIANEHRYLEELGIAYWAYAAQPNDEQIPLAVFGRLTEYVATVAKPILMEADETDMAIKRENALRSLRAASAIPWNGLPTQADRF